MRGHPAYISAGTEVEAADSRCKARETPNDAGNFDRGNGGRVVANSSTSAQSLVDKALATGGGDNVSVILLRDS
jgi:serine/threonine protein phosphatase PrpC